QVSNRLPEPVRAPPAQASSAADVLAGECRDAVDDLVAERACGLGLATRGDPADVGQAPWHEERGQHLEMLVRQRTGGAVPGDQAAAGVAERGLPEVEEEHRGDV